MAGARRPHPGEPQPPVKARVRVTLKPDVFDPQGKVKRSCLFGCARRECQGRVDQRLRGRESVVEPGSK